MNDYFLYRDQQTRATELQDIAAMDRLAAQAAPASALRRYGKSHGDRSRSGGRAGWWRHVLPRAAGSTAAR